MDLSSSSEDQAVLSIPLYMDLLGSSGHSCLHGFIKQFWAFLFTWLYQAVLSIPLYMDLLGSSEDQAVVIILIYMDL